MLSRCERVQIVELVMEQESFVGKGDGFRYFKRKKLLMLRGIGPMPALYPVLGAALDAGVSARG